MKKTILTIISFAFLASVSAQLRVDISGNTHVDKNIYLNSTFNFIGSTASNIPITFKANNILAGFTGHSGNTNVSFGYGALPNLTGSNNTANGYMALYSNTTGYSNIANGSNALYSNTTGYYNTANGSNALYSNTTGFYNTANGSNALRSNTTGYSNIANGSNALYSNTTGYHNTANGNQALHSNTTGYYNTANGSNALYGNTTGYHNVANGVQALYNSTGCGNTASGYQALISNTTGNFNTAIGNNSGVSANNLNNAIAIGYNTLATANNQARIGNSSVTSIGGYANWSNISDGRVKKNIKTDVPGLHFINSLQPVTYNIDLDAMDELIGINKIKLPEKDSLEREMPKELKEILKKSREAKEKQIQTGFIAQDVEKTAKSIGYNFSGVDAPEDGNGAYGLRYAEFVVPLVKAVQELSEQNDKQQKQIEELTELVNKLLGKEDTPIYKGASNETSITGLPELPASSFSSSAALYQNIPNPFSQATQIKFYIPENIRSAQLCIYSLQGAQLKQIMLTQRGNGSETISGSQFSAGIYLYALIADGKEVDVKRMILTE